MTGQRTVDQVEEELKFLRFKLLAQEAKLVGEHDYEWTLRVQIQALELQKQRLMGIRPEG